MVQIEGSAGLRIDDEDDDEGRGRFENFFHSFRPFPYSPPLVPFEVGGRFCTE
jgi:hypothetical protein